MKKDKENKTERLVIRLKKGEKEQIRKLARSADLSISSYCMMSIFSRKIVAKTDIQTVLQLKKIGVNINQIAKYVNQIPCEERIHYAIDTINRYIVELKKITEELS